MPRMQIRVSLSSFPKWEAERSLGLPPPKSLPPSPMESADKAKEEGRRGDVEKVASIYYHYSPPLSPLSVGLLLALFLSLEISSPDALPLIRPTYSTAEVRNSPMLSYDVPPLPCSLARRYFLKNAHYFEIRCVASPLSAPWPLCPSSSSSSSSSFAAAAAAAARRRRRRLPSQLSFPGEAEEKKEERK